MPTKIWIVTYSDWDESGIFISAHDSEEGAILAVKDLDANKRGTQSYDYEETELQP